MRTGAAAQLACALEVLAPKPGNVSPGCDFADATCEEFVAAGVAIGPVMDAAAGRPLGVTIRTAVAASCAVTRSNTSLGIVLLFAPIAKAGAASRDAIRGVLEATTVDDAREVYAAIRVARPGGLGRVGAQDVAGEPTATLLEVMRLAAAHDDVAREYATAFAGVFETGLPALRSARAARLSWRDTVVEVALAFLASRPDTHLARRGGRARAEAVCRDARLAAAAGGVRSAAGRVALAALDASLRDPRNIGNPGTTADLTAATLFVALLDGAWPVRDGGCSDAPR